MEKKEERKCWFCKEPWFPRHQCKVKNALHALLVEKEEPEEEEKTVEDVTEEGQQAEGMAAQQPEEAKEELLSISLNAIEGTSRPDTFSVILKFNGKKAVGLIDSGSTSTFMDNEFAIRNQCPLIHTKTKRVVVAGGGELRYEIQVPEIVYDIQGEHFRNCFNLLPLKGYDVILGADWIFRYSPITLDLKKRELGITKDGRRIEFRDFTRPGKNIQVSGKQVDKMLRKGAVGCILQVCAISDEENFSGSIPEEIQEVLMQFPAVLQEPKGLPPRRNCDHIINLKKRGRTT